MTATIEDQDLNVSTLAALLTSTEPDLFAPALPGETNTERAARRQAAADITDALIEASIVGDPGSIAPGVEHVADLVRIRTARGADHAQGSTWIREAAA